MRVNRVGDGPIIGPDTDPSIGRNIQGPSLIRVPPWAPHPLGRYYLYFADHKGGYIRMAYADDLLGPWTVHVPGALRLADSHFLTTPPEATDEQMEQLAEIYTSIFGASKWSHDLLVDATTPHIASPDVHVDHARRRVVMYLHGLEALGWQVTRAATSTDGVTFDGRPEVLGRPYLRAFSHDGITYALTMPGVFSRSADGLTGFQEGPTLFQPEMRHSAVIVRDDTLHVFWTRVGDAPESILWSRVGMTPDWMEWTASDPVEVLRPELPWEGADAPREPSQRSTAYGTVNQLRDPAVFDDDGRTHLLYAVAGESGIALAEIDFDSGPLIGSDLDGGPSAVAQYGRPMPTPQQPLTSGFGRESTPADVLGDTDLSGKLAIVTGGYSGLGLETTKALAGAGADVVVPARRPEHTAKILAELDGLPGDVSVAELDLADLTSVAAFAGRMVAAGRPIDIVINNAGIMACPETRIGSGWEAQFATNHLGHYTLINELWPLLAAGGGARVVALSSTGHKLSPMRWDDVQFESGYDKWVAYGQAKTANALFAVQLDELGAAQDVRAFAVHPGGIMTELQRHLPQEEMINMGWMDEDGNINELFKSPEQGAATSVWAATSPQLDGMGGVYCEDCDISAPTDTDSPFARYLGVDAHAVDRDDAARLWTLSADLTGVNAFL